MKTISAKRHIAAFGAMLVATIGGMAFATPTAGLDGDVYYVSVPAGETVGATDANWSLWVSAASGHPFAKRGEGTLEAGDAMASFAGEIRIENGTYKVMTSGGLGTTAGATSVSNNATLFITSTVPDGEFGYSGGHNTEKFYFSGNGYNNQGALRVATSAVANSKRLKFVYLLGDAVFKGHSMMIASYAGYLNLNGHALTVVLDSNRIFNISEARIGTMGDITVESGSLQFDRIISVVDEPGYALTVKSGAALYLYSLYCTSAGLKMPWHLVLENGAVIRNGASNLVWSGPTTVSGLASIVRQEDAYGGWFRGTTLDGIVSGLGTFNVQRGQFLELTNPANDFSGAIALNGVNASTNSTLKISNNALPATSAGVTINYGNVELDGSVAVSGVETNKFSLPKLTCTSSGSVTCSGTIAGSGNKHTIKEVAKSGTGVMTLAGPLCVTGRTEVMAGTLRLGSRPPAVQTGLECYFLDVIHSPYYAPTYSSGNGGPWVVVKDIDEPPFTRLAGYWNTVDYFQSLYGLNYDPTPVELGYQGIDTNGISLAYKAWPVKILDVIYRGYLWIDGNESVTWNFAANIHNYCRLRIDGQDVIVNADNPKRTASSTVQDRLTTSNPITLAPGAHTFCLYMATFGNAQLYGPARLSADYGWAMNTGVVYNPNPGEVISSNSADYVQFTASQFSPTADRGKVNLDSSLYRASFEGGAKFATGTVFDIGDTAPYTPFPLASLEGAMTVTNGTLVLSGSWTIDAAEINAGGLVLAGDANLVFADGATLTVTNARQISNVHREGMPLVTCAGTGTVTGRPTILMEEDGWRIDEKDGNLNIHRQIGFMVIVQ